jgi:hypothetical protein
MPTRMDAAAPVDTQNAPTATWKTAQNAVSHSAHTPHRLSGEPKKNERQDANHASHTKFLTLPARTMFGFGNSISISARENVFAGHVGCQQDSWMVPFGKQQV